MPRPGTLSLLATLGFTSVAMAQTNPGWRPIVLDPPPAASVQGAEVSPFARVVSFQNPQSSSAPTASVVSPTVAFTPAPAPADLRPTLVPVPPTGASMPSIPPQGNAFVPVDGNCGCSPVVGIGGRVAPAPYAPMSVNSYRPLVPQPVAPQYTIGKGILGQPTLYVPGQPVRNVLRWLSP